MLLATRKWQRVSYTKGPHEKEWLLHLQLIPEDAKARDIRDDCLKYGGKDSFLFKDIKVNHSLNYKSEPLNEFF
jgi:hypothetical protein